MNKSTVTQRNTTKEKAAPEERRSGALDTNASSSSATKDFRDVFSALCKLLASYEDRLALKKPNPSYSYLESREPTYRNRPMFFAAVRAGKNYVSYHLMPVYGSPVLAARISPELRKRMQGKACFNFTAVNEPLFDELAELTEAGYNAFKKLNWL